MIMIMEKKKKLQLRKETIAVLTGYEMTQVGGGVDPSYHSGMETCGTNMPDCLNGGKAVAAGGGWTQNFYYVCDCLDGYHGDRCQYEHYKDSEICSELGMC